MVTKAKRAVVVGGGFIGIEMARLVENHLEKHGVLLELSDGVAGFKQKADGSLEVLTKSGKTHLADIVIMAIGVRPETELEILVFCRSGQRAYHATRVLLQNGFKARNIAGGMLARSHFAVGWK